MPPFCSMKVTGVDKIEPRIDADLATAIRDFLLRGGPLWITVTFSPQGRRQWCILIGGNNLLLFGLTSQENVNENKNAEHRGDQGRSCELLIIA
jgi:hypothetical protein